MIFNRRLKGTYIFLLALFGLFGIMDTSALLAQDKYPLPKILPKVTYGIVPDSLLQMTSYAPDPSADYIYAYKGVDIDFEVKNGSITAILRHHVRIKVLTDAGKKASIVDIPYYFKNDIERVQFIRGETIQPDGRRINMDNSNIRTIGVNDRFKLKEFNLPAVKVGSVLDYTYTIRRKYIEELPDFYFMNTQPTLYTRIRLINSKYIRYDATPVNMPNPPHFIQQKIDTSSVPKVFSIPQPEPVLIDNWYEFNVPALREEPYITSLDDYRWKMKFMWKSFGNPRQVLGKSWDIVAAELRQQNGLEDNMKNYPDLLKIGEKYQKKIPDKATRIDSIFRFVNKHVTYDGSTGVFSKENLDKIIKGGPGNQSAINQALIVILRGAGFKANPLLISTRDWGKILSDFPSIYQFNGMLAYCKVGDKPYFMDATQKYSIPNLLPTKLINGSGLLLKKKSYEWVTIAPDRSVYSMEVTINGELDDQGDLSGNISSVHHGYLAQKIRDQKHSDLSDYDIVHEDMLGQYTQPTIRNISFKNINHFEKPVEIKADFKIPQYANSFKSGLEFPPLIVGYQLKNPLGSDNRSLPVTLQAREMLNAHFRIKLPDGYRLKHRNDRMEMKIPGARMAFHYNAKDDILTYDFNVEVLRKNFGQDLFPQLISMYQKWVELSRTNLFISKVK